MKRLLDDFATVFDLEIPIEGVRLGDHIERKLDSFDLEHLPQWGLPGVAEKREVKRDASHDFYYSPHLFPDMDAKLRLAHLLQYYLLPRKVPEEAPLSIAAVLESYCHLSGDLFGWEMLEDNRFLIWIMDIAGHGVRSGIASAVLRILIANLLERGRIGNFVTELNSLFNQCMREDKGNLFATGFFMAVEHDGAARYASAGHPPMLLRENDGNIRTLCSTGLPLGMFADANIHAVDLELEASNTLLLYTDGLVESSNDHGEEFGFNRLVDFLKPSQSDPRTLNSALYRKIADFQDMDRLDDDVTFVIAQMH